MAKCVYCKRKGFLLFVNEAGLCDTRASNVGQEVSRQCKRLSARLKTLETSKTFTLAVRAFHEVADHVNFLAEFERTAGVEICEGGVEGLRKEALATLHNRANTEVQRAVSTAHQKSRDAATPATKLSPFSQAITKVIAIAREFEELPGVKHANLDTVVKDLRAASDRVRFQQEFRKAEKQAARGRSKDAIGTLIDAVVDLEASEVSDERIGELRARARQMIRDLEGGLPRSQSQV